MQQSLDSTDDLVTGKLPFSSSIATTTTAAQGDNLHVSSDEEEHEEVGESHQDGGQPSPKKILKRLEKLKKEENLDDIGELERSYDYLLASDDL